MEKILVVFCLMELGEQVSKRPEETVEQSLKEDQGFTRQKWSQALRRGGLPGEGV